MSKYARLIGRNRLTVRQAMVIHDCLNDPRTESMRQMYNYRYVLSNAHSKVYCSIPDNTKALYARLGSRNRMTRIQCNALIGFIESIMPLYKRDNPQVGRVLRNALYKLKRAWIVKFHRPISTLRMANKLSRLLLETPDPFDLMWHLHLWYNNPSNWGE